jgi:hypothetical protein
LGAASYFDDKLEEFYNVKRSQATRLGSKIMRRCVMVFISLLSPEGNGKEAIAYLKKLKAPKGITIRDVCFTLGSYDGVIIFEAPDTKKALKFALEIGVATGYLIETLNAVPVKEL